MGSNYSLLVFFLVFIGFNAQSSAIPSIYDGVLLQHVSNPLLREFLNPGVRFLIAGGLSFIAAGISSAGGLGGGGLFLPILTIVAGLDVKSATSLTAFMVMGGSVANMACIVVAGGGGTSKARIDYDMALLWEPAMLLGVSVGVILNQVLPEWLITVLFVVFIGFSTYKTCRSGVSYWRRESASQARMVSGDSTEKPLLSEGAEGGNLGIPWMTVVMLVVIWVSFFAVDLLRGNDDGQGIIDIEVCGKAYWAITLMQIPLAIVFTGWILYGQGCCPKNNNAASSSEAEQEENEGGVSERRQAAGSGRVVFPLMALLAGLLAGVFGIGGGMLISPILLQIGIPPQVTAATCSFMIFFASTMSSIQYVLLGMEQIKSALVLAAGCFVASLVGLTVVQRAVLKYGRASLIVFSIGTAMALSTVLMTSFGAVQTWRDYTSGKSMGFNKPC